MPLSLMLSRLALSVAWYNLTGGNLSLLSDGRAARTRPLLLRIQNNGFFAVAAVSSIIGIVFLVADWTPNTIAFALTSVFASLALFPKFRFKVRKSYLCKLTQIVFFLIRPCLVIHRFPFGVMDKEKPSR